MPREHQPALTKQQMERVTRAYLLGAGDSATEEGAIAAVNWATEVMVRATVLDLVFQGEALIKFELDGDYRVRRTTEPERIYIVDESPTAEEADRDRVRRLELPARPGRLVKASQLPRLRDGDLHAGRRRR